jgi:hypothetical protein
LEPQTRIALSKTEVAEWIGCSVDFLDKHVWHELRVVRRGRRLLVPVREVERWMAANAERVG